MVSKPVKMGRGWLLAFSGSLTGQDSHGFEGKGNFTTINTFIVIHEMHQSMNTSLKRFPF